ncbi:MAG: cofactor-independent phosphoglycerate mutase [Armatimonadetes bacterium]|nr:cofactor-independent phosphoglycerate mutase [Armatimonadota bacterium]MDE2205168.1 cofactor-independent phosphoglycerate mutase [Armatimonadota bacterium]
MKYILLVPDGAADEPLEVLDGKTPLQAARTPNLSRMAERGFTGSVQVTPLEMYPGSDAANMALLGYNPAEYYTGRGPIEAAAMQIPMEQRDVAFRCSLVSTDCERLTDYSSGHITTEEARPLVELADQKLGVSWRRLFPGVSYRNILRWSDGPTELETFAPHESVGTALDDIWPRGDQEDKVRSWIEDSINLLDGVAFNRNRRSEGKPPANMLWPWSPGRMPHLPPFTSLRGVTGAAVSGVDVARGLARLTGLEVIDVPGATGYFDTDYAAKGRAAAQALQRHDFVWIHVESPDEAGHAGDVDEKIRAIENFDRLTIGLLLAGISESADYRILCVPDHPTPIATRRHARGPVPYLLYDSREMLRGAGRAPFDERALDDVSRLQPEGWRLMDELFSAPRGPA